MVPGKNQRLWTVLYKLFLNPAPGYSEDIDLVQKKKGPIKPILQGIGEKISFFEEPRVVKPKANNNTILYRFTSEVAPVQRLKLKIEINCREHFNILGWNYVPFEVNSDWFSEFPAYAFCHLSWGLSTDKNAEAGTKPSQTTEP